MSLPSLGANSVAATMLPTCPAPSKSPPPSSGPRSQHPRPCEGLQDQPEGGLPTAPPLGGEAEEKRTQSCDTHVSPSPSFSCLLLISPAVLAFSVSGFSFLSHVLLLLFLFLLMLPVLILLCPAMCERRVSVHVCTSVSVHSSVGVSASTQGSTLG